MKRFSELLLAFLVVSACCCQAQQEPNPGGLAVGVYAAGGKMNGGGAYMGVYDARSFRHVLNPGFFVDFGALYPKGKAATDGVASFNYQSSYLLHRGVDAMRRPGVAFWTAGYSRLFENGNGANYGAGLMWRFPMRHSYGAIRVEYREMYVPAWGRQPGFRIAFEDLVAGD